MKQFNLGVYLTPTGNLALLCSKQIWITNRHVKFKQLIQGDFKALLPYYGGDFEGKEFFGDLLEQSLYLGRL